MLLWLMQGEDNDLGNFPSFLSGRLLARSLTVVSSVPLLTLKASLSKRNVREKEGRVADRRHRETPEDDGAEEGSVHPCVWYHGAMPHRQLVRALCWRRWAALLSPALCQLLRLPCLPASRSWCLTQGLDCRAPFSYGALEGEMPEQRV